jgi:hypothetical protein
MIPHLRLRAQQLQPKSSLSVSELVQAVGGIQAQEIAAALWSIGTRSAQLTAGDVEKARNEERSVILTWAMRGTRHLVATADYGWLLPLLAPYTIRANQRRYAELGLDEPLFAKAIPLMRDFLGAQGPQPRAVIGAMLNQQGIATEGQRLIHLIGRATLEEVLCFGPDVQGEETWVAVEDWVPIQWESGAMGKLAHRYFGAFAPATVEDFAAWAGLPISAARQGVAAIADSLVQIEDESETLYVLKSHVDLLHEQSSDPIVRLLPRYDTYLLGYRSREWMVDPAYMKRIHPGGGVLHAVMLINYQAAGTWKMSKSRKGLRVTVDPFAPLAEKLVPLIHAEAESMARFLGQALEKVDINTAST